MFKFYVSILDDHIVAYAHGIIPPATPRSNYNYYLLYKQPSPAKFTILCLTHFYCCK